MEEETNNNENQELVSEKTREQSTISFDANGRPEPLITLKDGKVNVKTFQLSMSRKHRMLLFIDLWTIAWIAGMTVAFAMAPGLAKYVWVSIPVGVLCLLCSIGKAIADFSNWMFTMNAMLGQIGSWYVDDVVGICQSFITAGVKLVEETAQDADMVKGESESVDVSGEEEHK